ncbi:MAG: lipocalin family protein [Pseudomonadota bacterium]
MKRKCGFLVLLLITMSGGCTSQATSTMQTVDFVDINRFMGDWFVIAHIPTFFEKDAFNAVERYEMNADGTIATTFIYRSGSAQGPEKEMDAKGFITEPASNAVWGMQFIWPIKADYRIVYLDEDYSVTMIGRAKRDYLWIMARAPELAPARLEELIGLAEKLGYDRKSIRLVPQVHNSQVQEAVAG